MKKALLTLSMLAMILSATNLQSQDLEDILNQLTEATTKAVYKQVYNFDSYIQMEISDLDQNSSIYEAYLSKDGSHYAVLFSDKGTRMVILFDTKNSSMLMLSEDEGEKTGVAIRIDPEALAEITAEASDDNPNYANFKTGKTKTILGYSCDEYRVKEDGAETSMWTSEKLGKEIAKEILANQQIFGGAFAHSSDINGMIMEYTYKEDSDGKTRSMKVTQIDLEAKNSIKVSDYAVMSMGQ